MTNDAGSGPRFHAGTAAIALLAVFLASLAASACRLANLERRLPASYADFMSKTRYIMTREERKIFLELPDSGRGAFIEEFWKRRDPDPTTETNEFKQEYDARVAAATNMFRGEGKEGWLTDRGRIYILFGPPMDRLTYPMDAEGFCREIWYYGAFPVIFIDEHCEGQFLLTAVNLEHLQALNIAQGKFQHTFDEDKKFFDYRIDVPKGQRTAAGFEGRVVIDIPYAGVWFTMRDERLETAFELSLEIANASGSRLWDFRDTRLLSMSEDELKAKRGQSYRVEVPLIMALPAAGTPDARFVLHSSIKTGSDGEALAKTLEFRLKY